MANVTDLMNVTDMQEMLTWSSNQTGGWIFPGLLVSFFIISFAAFAARWGKARALVASSFLVTLSAFLMSQAALVGFEWVLMGFVGVLVGLLMDAFYQ